MQHLKYLLFFCCLFLLTSCKKDKQDQELIYFVEMNIAGVDFYQSKDSSLRFNASTFNYFPTNNPPKTGYTAIVEGRTMSFYFMISGTAPGIYEIKTDNSNENRVMEASVNVKNNTSNYTDIQLTHLGFFQNVPQPLSIQIINVTSQYIEGSFQGNLWDKESKIMRMITKGKFRIPVAG